MTRECGTIKTKIALCATFPNEDIPTITAAKTINDKIPVQLSIVFEPKFVVCSE
jgi:hypothetical protein